MHSIIRTIDYPGRGTTLSIYNLTDIHAGTIYCNEKALDKVIAEIAANPFAYWGLGGDWCENITRRDERYKASEISHWALVDPKTKLGIVDIAGAQEAWIFKKLAPIAGKCLWVNCGNHEDGIYHRTERNMYSNMKTYIKKAGGIPPEQQIGIGYIGFVTLRMKRPGHTNTIVICAEHGCGGGKQKGGMVNNAARVFQQYECDLFFSGHTHTAFTMPHTMDTPKGEIWKFACKCGTFRSGAAVEKWDEDDPGPYEKKNGYGPADQAGVRVDIDPDTLNMSATVFQY